MYFAFHFLETIFLNEIVLHFLLILCASFFRLVYLFLLFVVRTISLCLVSSLQIVQTQYYLLFFYFLVCLLQAFYFLHHLWIAPLECVIVSYILWTKLGISVLVGMAILFVIMLIQTFFGKFFGKLR